MLQNRDRILTTHVGSLPRNAVLSDLLLRREAGEAIDPAMTAREMDRAVRETVAAQAAAGIDIGTMASSSASASRPTSRRACRGRRQIQAQGRKDFRRCRS